MHIFPNKMSRAFTSICWLLHQGQKIIILQHSMNKICICIKCALNCIMHARLIKYSVSKLYRYHILIYHYTCLHTCLPVFSSFASRALTVQFEQLTHILSCVTLSLTAYLMNMNFDYTTNWYSPNLGESTLTMIYEKLKYLFFPIVDVSGCSQNN